MASDVLDKVLSELRVPLGSKVIPGQWNGDLDACKQYADEHSAPMIAIWSNENCGHCAILEKPMLSANNLNEYLSQSGFVCCFTCSRDPFGKRQGAADGDGKYYHFCKGPNDLFAYPFVRFYWYANGGTQKIIDYSVHGDQVDGQQGIFDGKYEKAGQKIIDYIEQKSGFGDYEPPQNTTYKIAFDLNGGVGSIDAIEVIALEKDNLVGTIKLPSSAEVATSAYKTGYHLEYLIDQLGNRFEFGSTLKVSQDLVLKIIWAKDQQQEGPKPSPLPIPNPISFTMPPVQGQTKTYVKTQFPLRYKYESTGTRAVRISNNLSNLVVRGDIATSNPGMESQLIYAKFNPGLSAVPDYCFANCTNLATLDSTNNIKSIGNYAFLNCKSLSSASFLGTENQVLTHIGDYAFAGSGLKSVVINLQGSVSDSSTNTHCFANCTELTSVDMTKSTYMADHMFDGCTKLQRVTLNDYHSYINEYVFANCTMLSSITLPKNTYMLPPHMFDGCVNLREVKFQEPSQLKQLGAAVFAGCAKLTSVTLPASIDSLDYIDAEFLSGSSIDRIAFKGIGDDVLSQETKTKKEISIQTGKMHVTGFANLWKCGIDNNVPMVLCLTKGNGHGCGYCDHWATLIRSYTSQIANTSYLWFSGQYIDNPNEYNALEKQMKELGFSVPGTWIFPYLYWKKEDGSVVSWNPGHVNPGSPSIEKFWTNILKKTMDSKFSGYVGPETIVYTTNENLTTFGRGEDLSVTFVSSSGKEWVCSNDQVLYTPETRVDKYTTDEFKYGIWYYNIREAKEFADQNNLPLLLEFGSKGCDPCINFKKNTFNNQEFQDKIATKPCILCKVDIGNGQAFDYPTTSQAYYASHVVGDPKTYIPQLVYYWKKSDGTTYKEIWNYNYRSDPGNANYQTVLNKLDNMLGSYSHDPRFIAPAVRVVTDNYRYYERDLDSDLDGRYFVCDRKTSISEFSEHAMTILTGGGQTAPITITSIGLGDEVSIQDGAYQYFTVDASTSRYYDLSGVIFVIEDSIVAGLCTFENEIGGNYSSGGGSSTGYWIHFSDTSTRESLSKMIQEFEETSTPIVIFERRSLVDAIAIVGENESLAVQIDIDSATSQDDVKQLVANAVGSGQPIQSISNIEEIMQMVQFNTMIRYNVGFTTWAKKNEYALVDVASNDWATGAPAELRVFEARTGFDGNSVSDQLPKILVYHGCSSCTTDGTTAIYCKKKIEVDYSKNMNYYKNLIDAYANLQPGI